MAITYNNLYMDIRQQLRRADLPGATLEARELVCYGASKTREELQRDGHLYVPEAIESRIRRLVQQHLDGEPVAYLIGEWEFYGLPLDISPDVLIPRPDTEVLAGAAIEYVRGKKTARVLDLCAGSGCVGLAVASQCPDAFVVLGDISEAALRICRQNIRRNNLLGRVVPYQVDALDKPPAHMGEFDCLVCNPPYIPDGDIAGLDSSVKDYEPLLALKGGEDGLAFYRNIVRRWRDLLTVDGRLYFEVGLGQADEVLRLMRTAGFGDIEVIPDLSGIPRVVYGTLCAEI